MDCARRDRRVRPSLEKKRLDPPYSPRSDRQNRRKELGRAVRVVVWEPGSTAIWAAAISIGFAVEGVTAVNIIGMITPGRAAAVCQKVITGSNFTAIYVRHLVALMRATAVLVSARSEPAAIQVINDIAARRAAAIEVNVVTASIVTAVDVVPLVARRWAAIVDSFIVAIFITVAAILVVYGCATARAALVGPMTRAPWRNAELAPEVFIAGLDAVAVVVIVAYERRPVLAARRWITCFIAIAGIAVVAVDIDPDTASRRVSEVVSWVAALVCTGVIVVTEPVVSLEVARIEHAATEGEGAAKAVVAFRGAPSSTMFVHGADLFSIAEGAIVAHLRGLAFNSNAASQVSFRVRRFAKNVGWLIAQIVRR